MNELLFTIFDHSKVTQEVIAVAFWVFVFPYLSIILENWLEEGLG